MRLFINSPLRVLLQVALERLGEPAPVVALPSGAGHLLLRLPSNPVVVEWHRLWQQVLGGQVNLVELSPAHVAACAEACSNILTESSYFGKVCRSPRFHQQLCARFVEWQRDGLTPERLSRAAPMVARPPLDSLAGIELDELRAEWLRKVEELCALWREWEQQMQRWSLSHPSACWWEAVERVQRGQVELPPRMLLAGFHELHEVDIALLRAAKQRGCEVYLTLPYDASHPLVARLRPYLSDLSDLSDESDMVAGASTAIVVLSAPDPLREVEVVARQILHHLQQGVPAEQIVLILRQPAAAMERLTLLFERYGIPLALEIHLPLSRSPLVGVVLNALRLLLGHGTGVDWLEWLKNPNLGWSREVHYRLAQVGKRALPADEWLNEAHRRLAEVSPFDAVFARLREYQQLLRQPSHDLHTVLKALSEWLEPSPLDIQARNELTAVGKLKELAHAYMPMFQRMPAARAVAYLVRLCEVELYPHLLGREGVRVAPLEHAGLLQAEVAFLMELIEGVLPRRHPDDPFLRESERRALRAYFEGQGERVYLPLRSERQRIEPLLFAEAIAVAAPYLYLSYPRVIEESETLPSSYLQQLPPHETRFYRLEDLIPPETERLHPYDRALAHAAQLGPSDSSDLSDESAASDRLTLPTTRQQVMDINRTFSVSELETLHRCPFQYLFRYRLRVRVPRRGLHLTQVGSVLHAALRRAYRHHCALPPDSPEWAQLLLDSLERVLGETPLELTHWQLQVLHAYATRLLQLFAQREPRYRQQFGLEPRHFEWAFGTPISSDEENPLPDEAANLSDWFDPDSVQGAFRLSLGGGHSIRLSGVVDRIDFSPTGKVAMITDYKLTRSPLRCEIEAGVAFQPLLYTLVVHARFGAERVVMAFDELSHGRRVRFVPYDEGLIRRFCAGEWEGNPAEMMMVLSQPRLTQAIQRLREELRHLLALLQQATVLPTRGEHCRLCAFGDLCRRAQR